MLQPVNLWCLRFSASILRCAFEHFLSCIHYRLTQYNIITWDDWEERSSKNYSSIFSWNVLKGNSRAKSVLVSQTEERDSITHRLVPGAQSYWSNNRGASFLLPAEMTLWSEGVSVPHGRSVFNWNKWENHTIPIPSSRKKHTFRNFVLCQRLKYKNLKCATWNDLVAKTLTPKRKGGKPKIVL